MTRCIFCGYCEVACPFDAITMGHDYELSDYNRSDLIFTKEMLLADPVERTPLRETMRGRVRSRGLVEASSSSCRADGARRCRSESCSSAIRSTACSRWSCT